MSDIKKGRIILLSGYWYPVYRAVDQQSFFADPDPAVFFMWIWIQLKIV